MVNLDLFLPNPRSDPLQGRYDEGTLMDHYRCVEQKTREECKGYRNMNLIFQNMVNSQRLERAVNYLCNEHNLRSESCIAHYNGSK
ncbi:hypothetical protein Ciccas_011610 [Cichlidogyrus casuarinus]|uniref:COX assembly mitochondrial protein n=1 Tax=Cichlidogyrus casuarinus TaxID=1844966 RepID=A0ABD2PTP9_9PLAT